MNLRTHILLGYGYLVTLLVLSAAGAALGFQQLGADIGRLLAENFESVRASMTMLESLERQDSAVLGSLLGKPESKELVAKSEESFREGLMRAQAHINLPNEKEVVGAIADRFEAYRKSRDALLVSAPERPLTAYEEETFPQFEAVKQSVLALLEVNHQAMVRADQEAEQTANMRAALYGLLVAIALLSLGFLSREMRRNILDRLEELKSVAEAIASGDRSRRAPVRRTDELGLVARQLNAILDRERQVEGETEARLVAQRQLLLGLLGQMGRPAALVSSARAVVASTLTAVDEQIVRETLPRVLDAPGSDDPHSQDVASGPYRIRFELLRAGKHRHVGWLVTLSQVANHGSSES